MLRRQLGDATFLKMLGEVRRQAEWKTLDTDQFRRIAASFLPKGSRDSKLENFFDQWVYSTGIPNAQDRLYGEGQTRCLCAAGHRHPDRRA
jgi:aminopeptidase N